MAQSEAPAPETARKEYDHDDDILTNLYRGLLEQCRTLLVCFRPHDLQSSNSPSTGTTDRGANSNEASEIPVPGSSEENGGRHKQEEEVVLDNEHDLSGRSLSDIVAQIYLWGDVVDTGRAQATSTLSPDLYRTIVEILVECARDTKRLMQVCSTRDEVSVDTSQLDQWLEKASSILDSEDALERLGSDVESDESDQTLSSCLTMSTQDILESLDESVVLLMDLLPGIDHLSSLKHVPSYQPSVISFQVSDPARLSVSHVRSKFPNAPIDLAERLGEANWQRFCRLKTLQDIEKNFYAQELGRAIPIFRASTQPFSLFHHSISIKGTSCARSDDVKSSLSLYSSFERSETNSTERQNDVPPMPAEVALKKPFICSICCRDINVRNAFDWRVHVFNDLRPYICLETKCHELLTTFASRKAWAQHHQDSHSRHKLFECHDCDFSCQSYSQFDNHVSSRHPQLNSKQRTAIAAAATRYQHSDAERRSCPLCAKTGFGTSLRFINHVCQHMEDLALSILPRDNKIDLTPGESENLSLLSSRSTQAALPPYELSTEERYQQMKDHVIAGSAGAVPSSLTTTSLSTWGASHDESTSGAVGLSRSGIHSRHTSRSTPTDAADLYTRIGGHQPPNLAECPVEVEDWRKEKEMLSTYSPYREGGETMQLHTPTHASQFDHHSAIREIRRSLSKSPSKPFNFRSAMAGLPAYHHPMSRQSPGPTPRYRFSAHHGEAAIGNEEDDSIAKFPLRQEESEPVSGPSADELDRMERYIQIRERAARIPVPQGHTFGVLKTSGTARALRGSVFSGNILKERSLYTRHSYGDAIVGDHASLVDGELETDDIFDFFEGGMKTEQSDTEQKNAEQKDDFHRDE